MGSTPADITVTLQDSLGRPTPGKLIQISQTGGNSVISGPNPPVTNASGQIEFTAVDSNNETITYSAVDVTDGNLAFPQTGTVTFSDAPEPGCSNTFVAAPGFVAQPYATGFLAQNFCVDGICNSGCPGAFGLAFDASGNLYVFDQPTGDVYKIPPGGGVANSGTLLTQTAIPTLIELAVDGSGNLYGGVNEDRLALRPWRRRGGEDRYVHGRDRQHSCVGANLSGVVSDRSVERRPVCRRQLFRKCWWRSPEQRVVVANLKSCWDAEHCRCTRRCRGARTEQKHSRPAEISIFLPTEAEVRWQSSAVPTDQQLRR